MLIGGDDISNDVITLDTFSSKFVLTFVPIGGNLTAQSTERNSYSRDVVASSSFSRPAARTLRRACSQATTLVT